MFPNKYNDSITTHPELWIDNLAVYITVLNALYLARNEKEGIVGCEWTHIWQHLRKEVMKAVTFLAKSRYVNFKGSGMDCDLGYCGHASTFNKYTYKDKTYGKN